MIWIYSADVADWLAARALDARLAGHNVPDSVAFVALVGALAGLMVLGIVVGREITWRQVDADAAADETQVIPKFVDERMARPRPRGPRSKVVAHDQQTQQIPAVDPDATVAFPRGGGR